ncbi:pentatricopeptide repeat-containing protein At4g25270, chloroplastic [Ananas comosus]|uniref:Pentatricopeptide repeat-containing protein At4g25270, chloroplastic n=1 Tax=Ananas comosus TaxID=4615 RepID=A0A6P5FGH0_ANACO|nr:pentatricopeptide repeat-containing protein At4g25270, chloroplastic [Ananas comosus]
MRGACFARTSLPTCAIPRRTKRGKTPLHGRSRRRLRKPSTFSYPKSAPTPLLVPAPPPLSRVQLFDRVLSDLESLSSSSSSPPDPSLLSSLLDSALLLLPAASSPLLAARLRRLLPPALLRRRRALSAKLLRLLCALGLLDDAHHLFDQMPRRARSNPFVWNTLISAYADSGLFEDALALFFQMDEEDDDAVAPDRFTFPRALKACAGVGSLPLGLAVHRRAVRAGFGADVFVLNALVDMYAKCGDIQRARRAFDAIARRDLVSWNSMLIGYLRHGLLLNALDICRRMLDAGFEPDSITISAILSGFSSSSSSAYRNKLGIEIHGWAIRHGLEHDLSVANSLIGMYSEKGNVGRARLIFESMPRKDLVTWNSIISAHRRDRSVLLLYQRMVDSGLIPDRITFVSVLSACAKLGLVEDGRRLFAEMEEIYGIKPGMEHYGCVADMLGRAGLVEEAYNLISNQMPFDGGPTVWGALLFACSVRGNVEIGESAAERLFELEPDNEHNFELLMQIYRDAGRLEDAERVGRLMKARGLLERCDESSLSGSCIHIE